MIEVKVFCVRLGKDLNVTIVNQNFPILLTNFSIMTSLHQNYKESMKLKSFLIENVILMLSIKIGFNGSKIGF